MTGKKIKVLAAGCFDLLHYGHLRYLEEARKLGGENAELVVVVARDCTFMKRKGLPPVIREEERRALVEALKPVDRAILGDVDMNLEGVIQNVKPDIIALGYDQGDLADTLERRADVKVVRLGRYGNLSSSAIKSLIYCKWDPLNREGPSTGQNRRPSDQGSS